jgi:hypothetical protein
VAIDESFVAEDGYALPADITDDVSVWPAAALSWFAKAGMTGHYAAAHGARWSEFKQQLYIPAVQETSAYGQKLVGHVLRRFDPKRYLTLSRDPERFWGLYLGPSDRSGDTLLVVEDIVSAWRGAEVTDTLALLGNTMKPDALRWVIQEKYREAVVFLDGDNSQVKKNARQIQRALSFVPARIVETGRDPKSYSAAELRELVGRES